MYTRLYKLLVTVPPLAWVAVFLIAPYLFLFCFSFWSVQSQTIVHHWNLNNYRQLVRSPVYVQVLLRSMRIAGMVTVLSLALSFPLAYYVSFIAHARKELLYQLVIIPLWVSYLVRAYAWKTILGSDGVLNTLLQYTGVVRHPVEFLLYSPFAVVLTLTHIYTPFAFLPIYASLEHIPRNLVEASADLGASGFRIFRTVILPLALPGVLAAGRGNLALDADLRRAVADDHRAPGKAMEFPMKRAPWLRLHALLVFAFLYLPIAVLSIYLRRAVEILTTT